MKQLPKNVITRMEGISNINEAIKDLLDDGFDKKDIIKYIIHFRR